MKLSKIFFIFCFMFLVFFKAQNQPHSIEILDQMRISEPRNLVIFIHADWCKFCPAMKNSFEKNSEIKKIIKSDFYFADLNAEEKREIVFSNREFSYHPTGNNIGLHQLARELGSIHGLLSYPTLVILNVKNEIIFQYNGFLNANEIVVVLEKFK